MVTPEIKLVRRVKDLIKKGWTRGTYAKTKHGRSTSATSPKAARWCLSGAVMRARYERSELIVHSVSQIVRDAMESSLPSGYAITSFNDHPTTTKKKVLNFLDDVESRLKKSHK